MSEHLKANLIVLEAIEKIIYNLSELYHDAAILSYLENVETTGYKDGIDTPKELQVHFSAIEIYAQAIKEQVILVSSFIGFHDQDLSKNLVLESVDNLVFLRYWTSSHEKWFDNVIAMDNLLMERANLLRNNIIKFLSQVNAELQKSFPFSLQKIDGSKLSLDDLKRNPQASIQHAFMLLETQVRNKIGANSNLFGEALINAAFGNNGSLVFGETPAEQLGVRNFVSGAYATFRNPRMHREVKDNEHEALQLLAMIDLIMIIVEKAKVK